MRRNLLAVLTTLAAVAVIIAPQLAAASPAAASPAAPQLTHKWRDWNYRHILLYGVWSKKSSSTSAKGYLRDSRKDGRWVRVTVQGTTAGGKQTASDTFLFNGGKRSYTSTRFGFGESPAPAHVRVRACVLKSLNGKALGCGRWHRIY